MSFQDALDVEFPPKLAVALFTPSRYKFIRGGRGCVHPDTLIDTPSGQVKISEFKGGEVYSWQCGEIVTAMATKPIPYTVEQLYCVDFVDGRSIIVTDEHKFLTQRGWVELQLLRVSDSIVSLPHGFSASHLLSSSGTSPITLPLDAPHYSQKPADCLDDCYEYSRRCDQQLLFAEDIGLTFPRLLNDVLRHILHALSDLGGWVSALIHSQQQFLFPRPNLSCSLAKVERNWKDRGSYSVGISFEQILPSFRQSKLFHGKNNQETQAQHISEQHRGFDTWLNQDGSVRTIQDIGFFGNHDNSLESPSGVFILQKPRLVSKHSRQVYWDLHVKETNNYLSNGIVNHNSGKSWSVARALLLKAFSKPERVLCTREIQKSIKQSVHQLLKDQIESLGLNGFFQVLENEIRGLNGSAFYFSGLSDQTVESIKSFEGCTLVWCEEAHTITQRSWRILTPTIRADGSEIWATYNPELETDETHRMAVTDPQPDTISVELNYMDNPWFPEVLEKERLHAMATMKDEDYAHIWEGRCKPAVEGAIYFDAMSATQAAGRIREVPHDGALKTHVVFDLGMADSMTLILVQRVASEIRIIHYIEGNQRILADYSQELRALRLDDQPMNWGSIWLPHDGFHKRHQTGKDDATVLEGLGWAVERVPSTEVNTGIDRLREIFPRIYFNKTRTERLVECLKRYRWNINSKTGQATQPLHDEFSHGADCARYLALVADNLTNDSNIAKPLIYRKRYIA